MAVNGQREGYSCPTGYFTNKKKRAFCKIGVEAFCYLSKAEAICNRYPFEFTETSSILNMQNLETAVGRNDDVSALRVRQNKEVGPSSSAMPARGRESPCPTKDSAGGACPSPTVVLSSVTSAGRVS